MTRCVELDATGTLIDLIRKKDAAAAAAHWRRHLDLAEEFVLSTGVSDHSVLDLI